MAHFNPDREFGSYKRATAATGVTNKHIGDAELPRTELSTFDAGDYSCWRALAGNVLELPKEGSFQAVVGYL